MKLTPRDTQVHVRLSRDLKAAAEKAAAAELRSLSSLIEVLLVEYLESRKQERR